jgi:hypothetical protein
VRTRSRGAARSLLPAVVAAGTVLLSACSGTVTADQSTPPTTTTTSSSSAPSLSATPVPPSGSQSSPGTTATSSSSPEAATESNPRPADLNPDQVASAQAGLTAYAGYWDVINRALQEPTKDWSSELSRYTSEPALSSALHSLGQLAHAGQHAVGTTTVAPGVSSVATAQIAITDCVDSTRTDFLDQSGASMKAPNQAGSYFRHPATATVDQYQGGAWLVSQIAEDWTKTC